MCIFFICTGDGKKILMDQVLNTDDLLGDFCCKKDADPANQPMCYFPYNIPYPGRLVWIPANIKDTSIRSGKKTTCSGKLRCFCFHRYWDSDLAFPGVPLKLVKPNNSSKMIESRS